jgi:hypothetical protein
MVPIQVRCSVGVGSWTGIFCIHGGAPTDSRPGLGVNVTDVYRDARCYLKGSLTLKKHFSWRIQEGVDGPLEPELADNSDYGSGSAP